MATTRQALQTGVANIPVAGVLPGANATAGNQGIVSVGDPDDGNLQLKVYSDGTIAVRPYISQVTSGILSPRATTLITPIALTNDGTTRHRTLAFANTLDQSVNVFLDIYVNGNAVARHQVTVAASTTGSLSSGGAVNNYGSAANVTLVSTTPLATIDMPADQIRVLAQPTGIPTSGTLVIDYRGLS